MGQRFEFATANRILFGAGTIRDAGKIASEFGRRALVVTGRNPARADIFLQLLSAQEITAVTFSIAGEPDLQTIQRGTALARKEKCDHVIAIGGGSALDSGKAIAAMVANDGELLDYLEIIGRSQPLTKTPLPFIAIPTTAGTGSEVTRNAVLASPGHRAKVSLRSPLMLPRVAIVDPELTHDLPPAITASTGLDALTQLIEPYVCSRANPVTDALCVEGIKRAAKSLRNVFTDGRNAAAREDMALASVFGGIALANAGLGAVHGLAGPIGGMFPAPHGAVCAGLLPRVMEINLQALQQREPASAALQRYNHIAQLLTGNERATASDSVPWLRQLSTDLKIPPLRTYGITTADFAELIERAGKASSMKANPISLTSEELREILQAAL
jgi:alcohol dehydrogenase class IV